MKDLEEKLFKALMGALDDRDEFVSLVGPDVLAKPFRALAHETAAALMDGEFVQVDAGIGNLLAQKRLHDAAARSRRWESAAAENCEYSTANRRRHAWRQYACAAMTQYSDYKTIADNALAEEEKRFGPI